MFSNKNPHPGLGFAPILGVYGGFLRTRVWVKTLIVGKRESFLAVKARYKGSKDLVGHYSGSGVT